jgi:iron(III) transport system substrate-binding protein
MPAKRPRTRWIAATAAAGCAVLTLTSCSSGTGSGAGAAGQSPAPASALTVSAACTAGAKEGTLNFVSRTDPDVFAKEAAVFEQAHPGIKVKYTSATPNGETQQLITEAQARHALSADAVTTDLASAQPLFDQGMISNVAYKQLDIPTNLLLSYHGVNTFRVFRDLLGVGYNTKLVPKSDLPTTWDQLINSKWSGKVIADPRGTYLGVLADVWGQSKTMTWVNQFKSTDKPVVVQGTTDSITKVISGEALLTTSATASAIIQQQKSGAPIAMAYLDVVSSQDKYGVILKGAKHPNAAACFLSWLGSAGGQAAQLKYEFKSNDDLPGVVPAGATTAFVTDPAKQAVVTSTTTAISKLLTP